MAAGVLRDLVSEERSAGDPALIPGGVPELLRPARPVEPTNRGTIASGEDGRIGGA